MNTMASAATGSQQRKDELRASLFPLVEICPVEECNPEECPLYLLRKKKYTERLEWINALSEQDLAFLAAYHDVCLNVKLNETPTGENHLSPDASP